jgi:hypothetical protein
MAKQDALGNVQASMLVRLNESTPVARSAATSRVESMVDQHLIVNSSDVHFTATSIMQIR